MREADHIIDSLGGLPVCQEDAPFYFHMAKRLAARAGIPFPRLYIISDPAPNAFAVGLALEDSAVAVTTGLFKHLDEYEIEAVLGHEIGHIQMGHSVSKTEIAMKAMAISGTAIGVGNQIANSDVDFTPGDDDPDDLLSLILKVGAGAVVAAAGSAVATNMLSGNSFRAEFEADECGAIFAKKPWALSRALGKIERAITKNDTRYAPEVSQLFIISPLSLNYHTHPPTNERVARLATLSSPVREIGEVATIFCTFCGEKTDADGKYCYWCGHELESLNDLDNEMEPGVDPMLLIDRVESDFGLENEWGTDKQEKETERLRLCRVLEKSGWTDTADQLLAMQGYRVRRRRGRLFETNYFEIHKKGQRVAEMAGNKAYVKWVRATICKNRG